jgi:hypothetical protein
VAHGCALPTEAKKLERAKNAAHSAIDAAERAWLAYAGMLEVGCDRIRTFSAMSDELSPAKVRVTAGLGTLVDDEEDPARLWAEIHQLRAIVKGPEGYATWQEAAIAERAHRVRAENEVADAKHAMRAYARDNPRHEHQGPMHDPNGVHGWLARNDSPRESTTATACKEADQATSAQVQVDPPVDARVPKGMVAVLVGSDGREIANAADFNGGRPAGFSQREAQESRARRQLALVTMDTLASPQLTKAIDLYTAEQIVRRMCDQHGCRVVIVPVGHDA